MISEKIFYFSKSYLLKSPWFWSVLAVWQGLLAFVLLREIEYYVTVQPGLQSLQSDSGLLIQVFLPAYQWVFPWVFALFTGLLFWIKHAQQTLWQLTGITPPQQWQALIPLIFWLTLSLFLPLFFSGALLFFGFFPEIYQWLILNLAFWLVLLGFAALALCLLLWLPWAFAFLLLVLFWLLFLFWPASASIGDAWLPRVHWQAWAAGAVSWDSLAYFLFFIAFFLGLAWCKAVVYWQSLWRLLWFSGLVLLLGLGVSPILRENSGYWDVTQQKLHSIPLPVQRWASLLPEPLLIQVFLPNNHALRPTLLSFFKKYQRVYPEWQLQFIDPQQSPNLVPQEIERVGQALVGLGDKKVFIDFLNDRFLAQAVAQLGQTEQPLWWFIRGHGEAPLYSNSQQGLSQWVADLKAQGMRVQAHTFLTAEVLEIDRPPIVVLAGNTLPLLAQELEILEKFLKKGGRLLWLLPPTLAMSAESLQIEAQLMQLLDTLRIPGVVVLATAEVSAALLLPVAPAPQQNLVRLTGHFPYTAAFQALPSARWQIAPLLISPVESFADQQLLSPLTLDAEEASGPLTVALAYQAASFAINQEDRAKNLEGRVLLLGSVAAFSNQFFSLPGSQALRDQLLPWLYSQPHVAVFKPLYPLLKYPELYLYSVSTLILLVMPLSYLLIGAFFWWRKRYA